MPLPALQQISAVGMIWTVAVVTPGPNFLAAARIATLRDRRAGFAAVGGIGVGTLMWGLAGAFGVRLMFDAAPLLYTALTLMGACYLIYMGVRIVIGSFRSDRAMSGPAVPPAMWGPAFRLGLLTSVSNPKSALFVAALFAAVMPQGAPVGSALAAVLEMIVISMVWYALVVCLLTTRRAAALYGRMRRWIDRAAGTVFVLFGARIVLEHT